MQKDTPQVRTAAAHISISFLYFLPFLLSFRPCFLHFLPSFLPTFLFSFFSILLPIVFFLSLAFVDISHSPVLHAGNGADEERRRRGPKNVFTSCYRENHESSQSAPTQRTHPGGELYGFLESFYRFFLGLMKAGTENSVFWKHMSLNSVVNFGNTRRDQVCNERAQGSLSSKKNKSVCSTKIIMDHFK